jgi:1-acyl-sn-glycerol-3-phosphate acyltransferase
MVALILVPFRFIALFLVISSFALCSLTLYPWLKPKHWSLIIRITINLVCRACSLKVERSGNHNYTYHRSNAIVVANHFCWLDTIILYSVYFISFIGKIEMQRWPLLNIIIRSCNTIFINRKNKREILQTNLELSQQLTQGRCIGLFPEGTIGDGYQLLPFKAPFLEAGIIAKSTIISIIILYYRKDGQFAYELSYRKVNLIHNILRTMLLNGVRAKVLILPEIAAADFQSRGELCQYLYQTMNNAYHTR